MKLGRLPIAGLVLAGLLLAGLLDFSSWARRAASLPVPTNPNGDAAIALTGGSGLRIAAGVRLVGSGAADYLLISGVHPDVTLDEIAALAGGPADTYACCVELGRMAETTVGNAEEAARWAGENGHRRLIIVTSNYHMPRSLILLDRTMPDLELIAYPVQSRIDPASPFGSLQSLRGLGAEWAKWRITKARYGERKRAVS